MPIEILFLKDNTNIRSDFGNVYIIDKQHKMHSKKPVINNINKLKIYLYANLFNKRNILLGIKNY